MRVNMTIDIFSNSTIGIRAWFVCSLLDVGVNSSSGIKKSWRKYWHDHTIRCMADMGNNVGGGNETQPSIVKEDIKKLKIRAGKAMHVLLMTVEDDILQHIKDAKTPKEAWDTQCFVRTHQ
ncbi:Integrase, catalytic core [Senna tora]|uniref:Integrase, catalytic core n=1 Tax=Senna tora TaxID=362788 RepID=A0A834TDD5_9FABA|nr:Integrase, catalytic core [Senna tora]